MQGRRDLIDKEQVCSAGYKEGERNHRNFLSKTGGNREDLRGLRGSVLIHPSNKRKSSRSRADWRGPK